MALINEAGQVFNYLHSHFGRDERLTSLQWRRGRYTRLNAVAKGADKDSGPSIPEQQSRRDLVLASVNFAVLGSTANTPDIRTAVNSILGVQ